MDQPEGWLAAVKLVGGALAIIIIGVSGWITGKKRGPSTENTEVVAATFTDRGLMEALTAALRDTIAAVKASTGETTKLVDLLEADAHRREIEAEVRQVLRDRGIVE